jgi:hypothetical protein
VSLMQVSFCEMESIRFTDDILTVNIALNSAVSQRKISQILAQFQVGIETGFSERLKKRRFSDQQSS